MLTAIPLLWLKPRLPLAILPVYPFLFLLFSAALFRLAERLARAFFKTLRFASRAALGQDRLLHLHLRSAAEAVAGARGDAVEALPTA